jgi:hypothetical protein
VGLPVALPPSVVQDAHRTFASMRRGNTIRCMTRAGVVVTFDRSAKACQAALQRPWDRTIRGGTRIRTDRGEATIIGACGDGEGGACGRGFGG